MKYWLMLACAVSTFQTAAYADFLGAFKAVNINIPNAVDKSVAVLPANVQSAAPAVRQDLTKMSQDDLDVLYYSADPCKYPQLLSCNGVPSADVKAFVSAERDRRKDAEARSDSDHNLYLASGGFGVSVLSLMLSAFGALNSRASKKKK
jgi:hypothetical protein